MAAVSYTSVKIRVPQFDIDVFTHYPGKLVSITLQKVPTCTFTI